MDKLTREEIEKMTPGQLRLAVAERIFNIRGFCVPVDGVVFIHREYLDPGDYWYWDGMYQEVLPNYPEEIAAAWLVLDKIPAKKWEMFQNYMEDTNFFCKTSKEAAAIICRAALIAVSN